MFLVSAISWHDFNFDIGKYLNKNVDGSEDLLLPDPFLLPFDLKLQPKATQCGIISVFILSCAVAKAAHRVQPSA